MGEDGDPEKAKTPTLSGDLVRVLIAREVGLTGVHEDSFFGARKVCSKLERGANSLFQGLVSSKVGRGNSLLGMRNKRGDPKGNGGESRIPKENGEILSKLGLQNPGSPGAGPSSQYSPRELV